MSHSSFHLLIKIDLPYIDCLDHKGVICILPASEKDLNWYINCLSIWYDVHISSSVSCCVHLDKNKQTLLQCHNYYHQFLNLFFFIVNQNQCKRTGCAQDGYCKETIFGAHCYCQDGYYHTDDGQCLGNIMIGILQLYWQKRHYHSKKLEGHLPFMLLWHMVGEGVMGPQDVSTLSSANVQSFCFC